ncbi:hypothetical protein D3C84_1226830 [compost metagenome]
MSQSSSDSTGISGARARSPSLSRRWAAKSATVTGEASAFSSIARSLCQNGRIRSPALCTRSMTAGIRVCVML